MGVGEGKGWGAGSARGKQERVAVPAMPMPLAVVCCILNFLVPGLGTIIAGFSAFCCARNEDMTFFSRCGSCCISFAIGILQLLTVALLLIGWIWSCVWGVFFLGMSTEYYHDNPPDNTRGAVINNQTTVVVQPGPTGYQQYPQYPVAGGYSQGYPQTQQPTMYGAGAYPQPHPQQPVGPPPPNIAQPPAYSGPPPGPNDMYEPPPPYTESPGQVAPSAPPAEKH